MIIFKQPSTRLEEFTPAEDLKKARELIADARRICNSRNWKRSRQFLDQAYAALADVINEVYFQ
jgi:hypothetical protein